MSFDVNESISSLVDGELDSTNRKTIIDKLRQGKEYQATLGRYCLISQALKRDLPSSPSNDLFFRVQSALESEPVLLSPSPATTVDEVKSAEVVNLSDQRDKQKIASSKPAVGFAVAASIAMATVLGFQFMSANNDVGTVVMPVASTQVMPMPTTTPEVQVASTRPVAPVTTVSTAVEEPLYAEQSVINDGQWTRITHIGNMTLNGNVINHQAESHASINLRSNTIPFARAVNLENAPAQ